MGRLTRGNTAARACQAASPGGRGLPIRSRDHRTSPDLVAKCRPAPTPTIRPEVSNFTASSWELVHVECTPHADDCPLGPVTAGFWSRRTIEIPRASVHPGCGLVSGGDSPAQSVMYRSVAVTFYTPLPVTVACFGRPPGSSVT